MSNRMFPFEITTGIGQAVAKIVSARVDRRVNVEKCAAQVVRHLEAANDQAAAALIRAAVEQSKAVEPRSFHVLPRAPDGVLEWHEPTDLSADFIVEPDQARVFVRLASELAQVERIVAAGIDPPTRILFQGPSGTGKTLAARWLGGRLGMRVAIVRLDLAVGSFMGETAATLRKAFEEIHAAPCIFFLDEVDGLTGNRAKQDGSSADREMARTTSSLFQQIDALPPAQILIAATNFPKRLDEALLRRLPSKVVFHLPNRSSREAMLKRWWSRMTFENAALHRAIVLTEERSGAVTRALAMGAARGALLADEGDEIRAVHVEAAAEEAVLQ